MERYESYWKRIKGSETLEMFGFEGKQEPESVNVNLEGMIELFRVGYQQFSPLWKDIFSRECFDHIKKASTLASKEFHVSTDVWVKILYELSATFHKWTVNRNKLLDLMTPLYFARVASFVKESWEMTSEEAESLVEEQAMKFENQKEYLLKLWEGKAE